MNTTVAREWFKRAVTVGASILAPIVTLWVTKKTGSPELGGCAGAGVAAAGAAVVTKAIPYIIPTAAKVEASNAMPLPNPFGGPPAVRGSAPLSGPGGDILRK